MNDMHTSGLVAIPCREVVWTSSFVAVHRMVMRARGSKELFNDDPFPLHLKREKIGEVLLNAPDLNWVLMVDSDMLPPEDTVERLYQGLSAFDIVGGLCFARRPPYPVCAGIRDAHGQDTYLDLSTVATPVTEVDWVGTGCVMICRRVFETLPRPWFEPNDNGRGEDINFMRKAKASGFRIGCVVDLRVGHLGMSNIDREFAEHWNTSFSTERSEQRAADLWAQVRPIE